MTSGVRPTRRQLLATAGAGALGGLAGCADLLWAGNQESNHEQVELTIKSVPSDDDEIAASITSQFRENLTAAGIDATHEPVAATELYREILADREYDVFVARANTLGEPDALRRLLHSRFRGEAGWQNPFNYVNVTVDDLLEEQFETRGAEREASLAELLQLLGRVSPFTVVTFPDHRNGRRLSLPKTSRSKPNRPIGYLDLLSREPSDGPWDDPLRVGLAGDGFTNDLNPIATGSGRVNPFLGLLYDPLVRRVRGKYVPWLANDVSWEEGEGGLTATVDLRRDLSWHDGVPITATDVTFTVEFIGDTSLGKADHPVPAPRFREQQTAIASASRIDSHTVKFAFETPSKPIAKHALTLPLFPEHVWEPRAEPVGDYETEARTADNAEPIGSGLLAFDERSEGEFLSLEVFEDHALLDPSPSDRLDVIADFPQYAGVEFRVAPVQSALSEMLNQGQIDMTGTPLSSSIAEVVRAESGVTVDRSPPDTMYIVGYNLHHPQLGDPRFRSILSRLIDREYVVEELLAGHGSAPGTYAELVGLRSTTLTSSDAPPITEFPGSDGEIDVDRVRRSFESNGYRYDGDQLLDR